METKNTMELINIEGDVRPLIRKGSPKHETIFSNVVDFIILNPLLIEAFERLYRAKTGKEPDGEEELSEYNKWMDEWVAEAMDHACLTITWDYRDNVGEADVYGDYNAKLAKIAVQIELLGMPKAVEGIQYLTPKGLETVCCFNVEEGRVNCIVKTRGAKDAAIGFQPKIRAFLRDYGFGDVETLEGGLILNETDREYTTMAACSLATFK